jgi:hypothetical protein
MKLPTTLHHSACGRTLAASLALLLAAPVFGQATAPAPEETSPAPTAADTILLTPFQVDTTKDEGYFAQNTLAGSRLRTNIADLGASITVVTAQQLEDTASIDINDVFRYEANTEGSSTYTPSVQSLRNDGVVDVNAGFTSGASGAPQTNATANRVRGIGVPGSSTNYYPSISQVPFDAYNVQSIEISRGPNSMLFGLGSPAGIVNQTSAQAVLNRDSNSVSFRTDDNGSFRASAAFNRSVVDDKLAIYGAFLVDNKEFRRKPSHDDTKRAYGAITMRPFEKTIIRASFEGFENSNRRPNTLTPRDTVTEWRAGGAHAYDPTTGRIIRTATNEVVGPLALRAGSPRIAETRSWIESRPNYNPALWNAARTQYNGVNIFGGAALTNVNSVLYTPGLSLATSSRPILQVAQGQVQNYFYAQGDRYRQVYGTATNPAANAALYPAAEAAIFADPLNAVGYDMAWSQSNVWSATGNGVGSYRYPGVSDRSIYDWENVNILQMNFGSAENLTYNVEFEQEIVPNVNFAAGWFRQEFESASNYSVSQLNVATLFVDTNLKLPDGRDNPYFGQPYVEDFDPDRFINTEDNNNYRLMLAWTPDFTGNDNWTKWLGRHQFLTFGTRNESTTSLIRQRWFITGSDEAANRTILFSANPNNNANGTPTGWSRQNRSITRKYYLGAPGDQPFGNVTTTSGELNDLSYNGRLQFWDYDARGYRTLGVESGYIDMNASTGRAQRRIDSLSFGANSTLWNDRLITTFGVRKDDYRARNTTTAAIRDQAGNQVEPGLTNPQQFVDGVFQRDLVFDRWNRYDEIDGTTRTTGAVLRPFKNWRGIEQRAAEGSQWNQFLSSFGVSYNKSDNFNPPPSAQVDAFGTPLPKPSGEGEDYGFQFALFDNKLFARVNWFKATNDSERTNPGTSISRLTGNVDTTLFRNWARHIALINRGFDPTDSTNFGVGLTPADETALEQEISAIWGLPFDYYADIGTIGATRSAEAEGVEVQLTYNPTRNWTMKLTGGSQETVYANVLKEFDAWFDERNPTWQGARAADFLLPQFRQFQRYTTDNGLEVDLTNFFSSYGYRQEIRLGDQFGNENVQLYYNNVVTPQYNVARDLEGQAAPGQRKYRGSFLTNYKFDEGRLKGFNVGGSMRWEDSAIIGYFGKVNPGTGSTDLTLSDTTRPIRDDSNTYVDVWVGYARKIWDDKVNMKVQLNVTNAFEDGGLRVVGVNYDGSPNAYRIIDSRQFVLTTKFDF